MALTPNETQVFELRSEDEWDSLLNWANALDGGASALPPALGVGDILVRRPDGTYEVFRRYVKPAETPKEVSERSLARIDIFRIVSQASRWAGDSNKSNLELAQELENWVFEDDKH